MEPDEGPAASVKNVAPGRIVGHGPPKPWSRSGVQLDEARLWTGPRHLYADLVFGWRRATMRRLMRLLHCLAHLVMLLCVGGAVT